MSLIAGQLVVPTVLWGRRAPSHRVACLAALPDGASLVSGTHDGQLALWQPSAHDQHTLTAKYLLFGHSASICCISPAGVDRTTTRFVSSCANGRMCLWESSDGRCVDSSNGFNIHTKIYPHSLRVSASVAQTRLFCIGHYAEILVVDPHDLQVVFSLASRVEPNWFVALCLLKAHQRQDVAIGVSHTGMVKIWSLTDIQIRDSNNPIYEDESKNVACEGVIELQACPLNPRTMLIVSGKKLQIFDASDFAELTSVETDGQWLGGSFIAVDKVAACAATGTTHLYQLPRRKLRGKALSSIFGANPPKVTPGDQPFCYLTLDFNNSPENRISFCEFTYQFKIGESEKRLIRGDSKGSLLIWDIPDVTDKAILALQQESFQTLPNLDPKSTVSFQAAWTDADNSPTGIVDYFSEREEITATLYVPSQGRLFLGQKDGSILYMSATWALTQQLLDISPIFKEKMAPIEPVHAARTLGGHGGAVTALCYPFEEHARYDAHHLLSGGADFAVCLWDVVTGARLCRFSVQAGPIARLIVPPDNCNARVLSSVCSVATDHSVALLSLKELKCVLLASRHVYPVREVRFRPLDDFLLVRCDDASVYVWQMETANLDRVVTGVLAEEVMEACREQQTDANAAPDDSAGASSAVQLFRAIRHKNVAAMRKIAGGDGTNVSGADEKQIQLFPSMHIQQMRTHKNDRHFHLVLFNVDALITNLLAEEHNMHPGTSLAEATVGGSTPSLTGLLARAKDALQLSPASQRRAATAAAADGGDKSKLSRASTVEAEAELNMAVARLLVSLLHAWTLERDLDQVCVRKLGLLKPRRPVSFGLVSRHGHLTLLLPEVEKKLSESAENVAIQSNFAQFAMNVHWQLSGSITTQHLLAVIGTANTLMSMQHAAFLIDQEKKRQMARRLSQSGRQSSQSSLESSSAEQSQIKQGWSLLAALHCVLLPDLVPKGTYSPPRIELLARRWQDRCLELREAAQALLLRELKRTGTAGRKRLIEAWSPFLPTSLDPSLSIFGRSVTPGAQDTMQSTNSRDLLNYDPMTGVRGEANLQQVRRNQATAVVLLGVIGAEYGQEIAERVPAAAAATAAPPEGFTEKDQSLARATSQALLELLIQPATYLLPPHSPLRRAGMDLLGRGFVVWQPYLDISKVLLGLLDFCAESEKLLPSGPQVFPLSPAADSCRTARHALSLIASARPPAFITALSKEVARYNAAAQHQTLQHNVVSPLLRSRKEILRVIELLAEKQYNEVADLMIAVGDILVHCLDTSLLKQKSLAEIFPPITKFHMVSYCASSRRIAFGGKNGAVVLHELRASKAQTIQAHGRAVTAVAFSEDGKHLATYSADEAKLTFWQASQSFLGMGQSQVKCVKQLSAPGAFPIGTPGGSPQPFRARLVWITPKSITLLLPHSKEHRFSL